MNKHPCQYTIIRFAPFAETGEFANIGLAMFVPALGELHFTLAPARFARVNKFFEDLEPGIFANALSMLKAELARLKHELPRVRGKNIGKQIFTDFTRRQSGLLHFSDIRVIRAENPAETATQLYEHYVGRSFNTREYRETVLQRNLKETFKRFKLERYYREEKIQAGLAEFKMPFVHRDENHLKVKAAIKPLAFDQQALNSQVEHVDRWYARARHMIEAGIQPEAVMFAIDWDSVTDPKIRDYVKRFEWRVRKKGINTDSATNESALVEFARIRT